MGGASAQSFAATAQLISGSFGFDALAPILQRLGGGLGLSAKFIETGEARETDRYHVYVHDPEKSYPPLAERAPLLHAALKALNAPPLALAWVAEINRTFTVDTPTFGFGASSNGAKLYVQMGVLNLPVSHDESLQDSLPSMRNAAQGGLISLEWRPREEGSQYVVLRHYDYEASRSTLEQLVQKWATPTGVADRALRALSSTGVYSGYLVWRSAAYRPESERVPPMSATKFGIFLKGSGVEVVQSMVSAPSGVATWARQAEESSSLLWGASAMVRVSWLPSLRAQQHCP